MITLTCKCGSKTITFKNLSQQDFPDGLKIECCQKALAMAPKIEVEEAAYKQLKQEKKRGRKPKA